MKINWMLDTQAVETHGVHRFIADLGVLGSASIDPRLNGDDVRVGWTVRLNAKRIADWGDDFTELGIQQVADIDIQETLRTAACDLLGL